MLAAVNRGLEIRARYGITGIATEADVRRAIADAGLVLWDDAPLEDGVYGLLYRGVICVKRGLLPGTRRVVLAHELAHHMLGHDGGLYRSGSLAGGFAATGEEARAQVGTYALLVGRPAPTLAALSAQVVVAHNDGGVPWDFLCAAETIFGHRHRHVRGLPFLTD